MRQKTAFWSIWDRNYVKERILNATLLNNIVAALSRNQQIAQSESIPFPNEQRYFGRTISQGDFFNQPAVRSQTPTKSWGNIR